MGDIFLSFHQDRGELSSHPPHILPPTKMFHFSDGAKTWYIAHKIQHYQNLNQSQSISLLVRWHRLKTRLGNSWWIFWRASATQPLLLFCIKQRKFLFVECINLLKTIQVNDNTALPPFFSKFANQHGLTIHPRKFRGIWHSFPWQQDGGLN